jgi:hypothetical protein
VPDLGTNFVACPSDSEAAPSSSVFRQYSALWRDYSSVLQIGPLKVTRSFGGGDVRSYASYEPKKDLCAKRSSFSRFPLLLASGGMKHRIESTGTIPGIWNIRWDAPSEADVAILEFVIHEGGRGGSSVVNVFVGPSEDGPFMQVDNNVDRCPNATDIAGFNCRNPQNRTLTVAVRGGKNNFYRFVVIPVVAVTMRMEMTVEDFYSTRGTFIVNMATLLQVSEERIKIVDVRKGSAIVDFNVLPETINIATPEEYVSHAEDIASIANTFEQAISNGQLQSAVGENIRILNVTSYAPPPPEFLIDPNVDKLDTAAPSFAPTAVPTLRPTIGSEEVPSPPSSGSSSLLNQEYFLPAVVAVGVVFLVIVGAGIYCYVRPFDAKVINKAPRVISPDSKAAPGASRPHYIARDFTFNAADIMEDPNSRQASYNPDGLFIVPASKGAPPEILLGSTPSSPMQVHSQSLDMSMSLESRIKAKPRNNAATGRIPSNLVVSSVSTEQFDV